MVFAMIVKPVLTEKEKTAEKSTFGAKIFAVNFLLDLLHGRTNVKYCQSYFKISLSLFFDQQSSEEMLLLHRRLQSSML